MCTLDLGGPRLVELKEITKESLVVQEAFSLTLYADSKMRPSGLAALLQLPSDHYGSWSTVLPLVQLSWAQTTSRIASLRLPNSLHAFESTGEPVYCHLLLHWTTGTALRPDRRGPKKLKALQSPDEGIVLLGSSRSSRSPQEAPVPTCRLFQMPQENGR